MKGWNLQESFIQYEEAFPDTELWKIQLLHCETVAFLSLKDFQYRVVWRDFGRRYFLIGWEMGLDDFHGLF